jgi:ABC-type lipoprotein export system ATPase subunit/predicted  nucleic acid-binding Zn-ribbon protein
MESARGSIWRKWDLHVHTPFTQMSNGYGDESSWDEFIDVIEKSDVQVIGVTDYNTAVNYFEFLKRYGIKYPETSKTFFFNLELRLEVSVNKSAEEVNIHVIFDNKIPGFETKINKFLTLLESTIDRSGANLAYSDLTTTDDHKRACINDYRQIKTILQKTFGAKKPYVIIGAANNAGLRPDNASPRKRETTDAIDEKCDGFFGNTSSREYYQDTGRYDSGERALKKPVFAGSDAHNMNDLKAWLGKQATKIEDGAEIVTKDITWIKADTTFNGLRQVFNEPTSRIFLGEMPHKLATVSENRTDYINGIKIYDKTGSVSSWFKSEIPLNPGLVAIIGKKGSGKSALTDIIALGGRSHADPNKLSFLTRDKFLNEDVAGNFALDIKWQSGELHSCDLKSTVDKNSELERVKYLPQKFVEGICNEFGVSRTFQDEIDRVIFSYVPHEKKLGTSSLSELIKVKGESVDRQVTDLVGRLTTLNSRITKLEDKIQPEYLLQINEKIEKKKEEIKSLTKPDPVAKPTTSDADKEDHEAVEALNVQITALETQITELNNELSKVNKKVQKYTNVREQLDSYRDGLAQLAVDLRDDLSDLQIDINDFITIKVKDTELDALKKPWIDRKEEINLLLGNTPYPEPSKPEDEKRLHLEAQKAVLIEKRKVINAKLTEPAKKYQAYVLALKRYETLVLGIQGAEKDPAENTINYLIKEQSYLSKELEPELAKLYVERNEFSEQIYTKKNSKTSFFEEIYQPLVDLLAAEKGSQEDADSVLEFTVEPVFKKELFISEFSRMINFGKKGFFMGRDEGSLAIKEIVRSHDTKTFEGIRAMAAEIVEKISISENGKHANVSSQLLVRPQEFYDFLFDIAYVEVQFNLQFNGKDLSQNQFSPGEKGALLLIFYLLIEKSNVPLIIDQPEENLDNESVFKLLVPYIRNVCEHRQVIIVTHNPNLAVVCDADQIIHADMNKKTNQIKYTYGSLESTSMNTKVSDVLEGTLPAFDIRNSKYARV